MSSKNFLLLPVLVFVMLVSLLFPMNRPPLEIKYL